MQNQVLIGTSGFYQQNFYPDSVKSADKLNYYSKEFPTVEINSTFYHTPRKSTIENWRSRVTEDFVFTFKVSKGFTHFRTKDVDKKKLKDWIGLFEPFSKDKVKHLMLFQFPASFAINEKWFDDLLSALPKSFLFVFEFRHSTWFTDTIYKKLLKGGHGLVLNDGLSDASGNPKWPKYDLDSDFSYIRFHGSEKLYYSSYTDEELSEYALLIKKKVKESKKVYCYFNNDAAGFAVENARTLMEIIKD